MKKKKKWKRIKKFYLYPFSTEKHIFSTKEPYAIHMILYYCKQMQYYALSNPKILVKIVLDDLGPYSKIEQKQIEDTLTGPNIKTMYS